MGRIIHLFLDTNVLVQCNPLHQLNWSKWGEANEIHLVISRPVQSEIDAHKNKAGDRLARRARTASSLLKEVITSEEGHMLIRQSAPTVKLFVRVELRPNQSLTNVLDYSHPDDQLVGIVSFFSKDNPSGLSRVTRYKPDGDKIMRLHAQTATIENGFVHLPETAHWLADYLRELTMFPAGRHDDQVDSTAQALAWTKIRPPGWGWSEYCREQLERANGTVS
jgi:hypothetical protein